MKKLICIVLTLAVLLSCAACAKKQTDEKTAAMETTIDRSSPEGMFGHIDQTVPVDGVYKIWSAVGVLNMVNHPDAKFELLCDVDMQGAVLAPIGSEQTPFTGSIEGTNYNIMNFTVQGSGESFGFVAVNKGSIQNLRLQNVTFLPADNAKFIGTCAGINEGNISRCFVSGAMDVTAAAAGAVCGGLTGSNLGKIVNVESAVDVNVTAKNVAFVGGITGTSKGGKVDYTDMNGKLDVTGANATVGLFAGDVQDTIFNGCAFVGASNTQDGKLFINFTGNSDDDELVVALDGRWRDNDVAPMPENIAALRDKVVNRMYEMGSIEWHVKEELLHDCKCSQSACVGIYTPDYT